MQEELILGTECKVKVTLPEISGVTPYVYDFEVEVYTNPSKRLTVDKDHCFPTEDEGYNFFVPFDSSKIGVGDITIEVVAQVEDDMFEDGYRTERFRIESIGTIIP